MNSAALVDAIGSAGDSYVADAHDDSVRKKAKHWLRWSVPAACLLLAAVGIVAAHRQKTPAEEAHSVQNWSEEMTAAEYFRYSNTEEAGGQAVSTEDALAEAPWAESRFFSDEREALETEGVIPVMEDRPLFGCEARYNADGSLYCLVFSWHRRGDMESYSDLSVTAGFREVEEISDCVVVELDENGNIAEPAVTVTQRDGVLIVAEGSRDREKTLTFQRAEGWYRIRGSWNDPYEDLLPLLDWFWERPVDFTRFAMGKGAQLSSFSGEPPEELAGYLPDFSVLGYHFQEGGGTEMDGQLRHYEAVYVSGVTAEQVRDWSYDPAEAMTVWWVIETKPDYYDRQDIAGPLSDLTRESVEAAFQDSQRLVFTWDDYCMMLYVGSNVPAEEAWRIIRSAQSVS